MVGTRTSGKKPAAKKVARKVAPRRVPSPTEEKEYWVLDPNGDRYDQEKPLTRTMAESVISDIIAEAGPSEANEIVVIKGKRIRFDVQSVIKLDE